MRFWTLVKKDLIESSPVIILGLLIFIVISILIIRDEASSYNEQFYPKYEGEMRSTTHWNSPLEGIGILIFIGGIAYAIVAGIVQFAEDDSKMKRPWGFLIHRSVRRQTILYAKLLAGLIGFLIVFGIPWVFLYSYACNRSVFLLPPVPRIFLEGWIYIGLAYTVYLTIAQAGVSQRKWYTTRLFPATFMIFPYFMVISQWRVIVAASITASFIILMLIWLLDTFLKREF